MAPSPEISRHFFCSSNRNSFFRRLLLPKSSNGDACRRCRRRRRIGAVGCFGVPARLGFAPKKFRLIFGFIQFSKPTFFFQRKNNDSSNFGQNLDRLFSKGKTDFKFFGSVFFPSEASVVIFLYRQPLELLFRFRLAAVTLALSLCYISAPMIDTKRDVGFKNTVIKSIEKS